MGIATVFQTGKRLTAAQLNLRPYLHAYQTVTQPVPTGFTGTGTAILFNAELVDTINGHDPAILNSRYHPTVPGWYRCVGQVAFNAHPTGNRSCHFARNGIIIDGAAPYSAFAALAEGSRAATPRCTASIFCNGGTDYIELLAHQSAGATINTHYLLNQTCSYMIIEWVAP